MRKSFVAWCIIAMMILIAQGVWANAAEEELCNDGNTMINGTCPPEPVREDYDKPLADKLNNIRLLGNEVGSNTYYGQYAGDALTSGLWNSFFGYNAGTNNVTGIDNTYIGWSAGQMSTGSENTFLGQDAGWNNTTGQYNTFVGSYTGANNGASNNGTFVGYEAGNINAANDNVFVGYKAGFANSSGNSNNFVGSSAGYNNTSGWYNTFFGNSAGKSNQIGAWNSFFGANAGENTTGDGNTFIGNFVGNQNTAANNNTYVGGNAASHNDGSNNVMVGRSAGQQTLTGNGNVFIGYNAGFNEQGSNKLYIANSNTSSPLIYGDFVSGITAVNGKLGIGTMAPAQQLHVQGGPGGTALLFRAATGTDAAVFVDVTNNATDTANLRFLRSGVTQWVLSNSPTDNSLRVAPTKNGSSLVITSGGNVGIGTTTPGAYKLYVSGTSYSTGGWQSSDVRFKEGIVPIEGPLQKVMKMEGVSYSWKTREYKDKGFPEGRHYGVVAQEIEKVLPEVVAEGPSGEKTVAYTELIAVLIEAMKEQQKTIIELSSEVKELRKELRLKGSMAMTDLK